MGILISNDDNIHVPKIKVLGKNTPIKSDDVGHHTLNHLKKALVHDA